ncbi:MAG: DUF1330 domain-containing protein [Gammaproteobacteria bacterium]|nr:DUF1330 domain-containing protein [Gammaproteobacteria bacterium]
MAAYMIIYARIHDRDKFISEYAPAAAALVEKFGGRYVLRAPGADVLEGSVEPNGSVVISEWPDKAAAEAFWNSAEYAAAKQLRNGVADVEVLLVDAPRIND